MQFSFAWQKIQAMINGAIALLPNIVLGLVVFLIFYVVAQWVKTLVRRVTEHRRGRNLGLVLSRLSQGGILLVGGLVALTIIVPDFTPGSLISALGVGGIAVGFAFRDIFENFLAGILILITEPFRIGDQIVFKTFEGTVTDIQTRATTIKTYDGRRVVIPNAELFTNSVTVNTAFDIRRLQYDVGIGYGDDSEQARELILQAIHGIDGVLHDPSPDVLMIDLAGSSVVMRARWWITPPLRSDVLQTQDQVLTAIKNTLVANGIDLPFPTQQILFHDQTEETDGDRARQREGWPAGKGTVPRPGGIAQTLWTLDMPRGHHADRMTRQAINGDHET